MKNHHYHQSNDERKERILFYVTQLILGIMFWLCMVVIGLMQAGKPYLLSLKMLKILGNLLILSMAYFIFYSRKNIPRGIISGVIVITLVYFLVNCSIICILNLEEIKSSNLIFETMANKIAGTDKFFFMQNLISLFCKDHLYPLPYQSLLHSHCLDPS